MAQPINPVRMNHINIVVEDFAASTAHFADLFGADFLLDLPQAEWHAGLIDFGRVIFELFAPPTFLLNARYGPHYLGVEYQADMAAVRAAIAAHGIRIARDIGVALHTHPHDTLGVAFEFYDGSFHDNDWPLLGRKMHPASHWREAHGLGLLGLKHYAIAVADIAAADIFIASFLGGERLYEEERPLLNARVVGWQCGDGVIELQAPLGAGALQRHLDRWGNGIRSTVFAVQDLSLARRYFEERGVAPQDGSSDDSFALPSSASGGVLFEFSR